MTKNLICYSSLKGIILAHPLKHHFFYSVEAFDSIEIKRIVFTSIHSNSLIGRVARKLSKRMTGYEIKINANTKIKTCSISYILRVICGSRAEKFGYYFFDLYVAFNLLLRYRDRNYVFFSVQDYLPISVNVANKLGMFIVNDQILNSFYSSYIRINGFMPEIGKYKRNLDLLNKASLTLVPSKYVFDDLVRDIPECISSTRIVPYGSGSEFPPLTNPKQWSKSGQLRVAVRANIPRKGSTQFIEFLEKYGHILKSKLGLSDLTFLGIGSFSRDLSNALVSASRFCDFEVKFEDIPHSSMPEFFVSCDVLLMPSLSEGFSLLCVEAMSQGVPLLISDYCGIDSFVDDFHGVSIDVTSQGIFDGLVTFCDRRDRWKEFSDNCIALSKLYTWNEYRKNLRNLIFEQ
jgi:glycosyltransferase involved in cell wall biosynthesis